MGRRRLAQRSPLQTFCLITVVATDDEKIAECCRGFGADVIMTAESCRYGAERCSEALQGDEPLIEPEIIKGLSKLCRYHLVLLCTRPPEAAMFGQLPRLLIVPLIAIIGREQTDPTSPDERVPEPPRPTVYSFCKVLTASDTSTHGGFSVLRKHANECLRALDMTQATPAQDLQAFDLHGTEWRFKHIFMGQPRRHMLITGWSTFVTNKRLVAGDSFVFLRGEYGETRVGVRRQAHQPSSMPTSVISSQSMHLGVLATASHAVSTQTHFVVYYKQRTSQFIVSLNKYIEAVNNAFTVEMRFKMRFEGDDSPEKRFTRTIVAVGDVSPQWEDSKWRSLKHVLAWTNKLMIWRFEEICRTEELLGVRTGKQLMTMKTDYWTHSEQEQIEERTVR